MHAGDRARAGSAAARRSSCTTASRRSTRPPSASARSCPTARVVGGARPDGREAARAGDARRSCAATPTCWCAPRSSRPGSTSRSANTLIVERADALGLAQLYQIRGPRRPLARARLRLPLLPLAPRRSPRTRRSACPTLSDYTELGSGFKIAMRDLEIRGAGNLLGDEQSGHVAAVGFELYVAMLDEAVRRARPATRRRRGARAGAPRRARRRLRARRLRALRGGQDRDPPPRRRRARDRRPDRAARGARGPLRPDAGAAREPDPAPGRAHQARAGPAHGRRASARGGSRVRRSSSTRAARRRCARSCPRRDLRVRRKRTVRVRVPEDPAARFPAVVAAAEALLARRTRSLSVMIGRRSRAVRRRPRLARRIAHAACALCRRCRLTLMSRAARRLSPVAVIVAVVRSPVAVAGSPTSSVATVGGRRPRRTSTTG